MAAIDRARLRDLWAAVDSAATNHAKGRALEDLVAWIFEQIPGMTVTARDQLSAAGDQEIDIAFWNDQELDGLRQFDPIILVECKNWSVAVSSHEVAWFLHKMRDRGRPFGILVAANGITGEVEERSRAQAVVASALREERELVVVTRAELELLTESADLVRLLKTKRAYLAASGGAL